jgi:hypothetical protein
MCYSAQIEANYRKYVRMFVDVLNWTPSTPMDISES